MYSSRKASSTDAVFSVVLICRRPTTERTRNLSRRSDALHEPAHLSPHPFACSPQWPGPQGAPSE